MELALGVATRQTQYTWIYIGRLGDLTASHRSDWALVCPLRDWPLEQGLAPLSCRRSWYYAGYCWCNILSIPFQQWHRRSNTTITLESCSAMTPAGGSYANALFRGHSAPFSMYNGCRYSFRTSAAWCLTCRDRSALLSCSGTHDTGVGRSGWSGAPAHAPQTELISRDCFCFSFHRSRSSERLLFLLVGTSRCDVLVLGRDGASRRPPLLVGTLRWMSPPA